MRGQESEAYEIDARTTARLQAMDLKESGRDEFNRRVFTRGNNETQRVVRDMGGRNNSVIDYGSVILQALNKGAWADQYRVPVSDFIKPETPFPTLNRG